MDADRNTKEQTAKLRRFRWVVLVALGGIVCFRPWDTLAPLWGCALGVYLASMVGDAPPVAPSATTAKQRIRAGIAPLVIGLALSLVVPMVGLVRAELLSVDCIDERIRSELTFEVYLLRQNGRLINNSNATRWYRLYESVLENELMLEGYDGRDLCIANPSCPTTENQGLAYLPSGDFLSLYRKQLRGRWLRAGMLAALWFLVTAPFFLAGRQRQEWAVYAALYAAAGITVTATIMLGLLPVWNTAFAALSPWLLLPALVVNSGLVLWVMGRPRGPARSGGE